MFPLFVSRITTGRAVGGGILLLLACTPLPETSNTPTSDSMTSDTPTSDSMTSSAVGKISFDLEQFDANGLYGPADGKRSLDYEFCIPQGQAYAEDVQAIDPTVDFYPRSSGRIGCDPDTQTLVIGNTHNNQPRLTLLELANLDYVERIEQVYWE